MCGPHITTQEENRIKGTARGFLLQCLWAWNASCCSCLVVVPLHRPHTAGWTLTGPGLWGRRVLSAELILQGGVFFSVMGLKAYVGVSG